MENMIEGRGKRYLYSDLAILCPVTANKLANHSSASTLKPSQGAKRLKSSLQGTENYETNTALYHTIVQSALPLSLLCVGRVEMG